MRIRPFLLFESFYVGNKECPRAEAASGRYTGWAEARFETNFRRR